MTETFLVLTTQIYEFWLGINCIYYQQTTNNNLIWYEPIYKLT